MFEGLDDPVLVVALYDAEDGLPTADARLLAFLQLVMSDDAHTNLKQNVPPECGVIELIVKNSRRCDLKQ